LRSLPELDAPACDAAALVLLCEGGDAALAARLPLLRLAVETPEHYALARRLHSVAGNAEPMARATGTLLTLIQATLARRTQP
jgi:hypothetical protein